MKIVSLDVHAESSQLTAVSEEGEIILELMIPTEPDELRRIVGGMPGPKRVVFEEGQRRVRSQAELPGEFHGEADRWRSRD